MIPVSGKGFPIERAYVMEVKVFLQAKATRRLSS